jgi:hypothetical protein
MPFGDKYDFRRMLFSGGSSLSFGGFFRQSREAAADGFEELVTPGRRSVVVAGWTVRRLQALSTTPVGYEVEMAFHGAPTCVFQFQSLTEERRLAVYAARKGKPPSWIDAVTGAAVDVCRPFPADAAG